MPLAIASPFPVYVDLDGLPLDRGSLYFGSTNQNPETNPVTVYWDAAGTQPAAQPITTLNGIPTRAGTPAQIFVNGDYSLTVRTRRGELVYYAASAANSAIQLSADLANTTDAAKGAALVGFLQAGAGALGRTALSKLRETISVEDFGAIGNGVADDTAAFAAAAALGRRVVLRDGAIYLLSARISLITGSGFICDGIATIRLKTGAGGFNSTDLTTSKTATNKCVFYANAVDDIELSGLWFQPDGVTQVVIHPVQVFGGTASKGIKLNRLHFEAFPICAGGLVALNTIGAGSYDARDISASNCGTSSTAWTGTLPQITVFEVDNDMVGGVPSVHGFAENIRGVNLAFTGAALTLYGQQTDVVNIAGIGDNRKGPTILGVYGDTVGEIVDLFCSHAIVKGVRGRNAYNYGVKLVHGALCNDVELETIENFGIAAVTFAGSSTAGVPTAFNSVKVGAVRVNTDVAGAATTAVVLFQDNGGTAGNLGLPKSNHCRVDFVQGDGVNLDYVVRDGGAANNNDNSVEVVRATGWVVNFCSAPPGNERVRYRQNPRAAMTMSANQTLTTNVWTRLAVNTTAVDTDGGADTANNRVRCRFPGPKLVKGSVRIAGLNANDDIGIRLLLNGTIVGLIETEAVSGGLVYSIDVSKVVYINEDACGTSAADITCEVIAVGAGALQVLNTASASYLDVADLG